MGCLPASEAGGSLPAGRVLPWQREKDPKPGQRGRGLGENLAVWPLQPSKHLIPCCAHALGIGVCLFESAAEHACTELALSFVPVPGSSRLLFFPLLLSGFSSFLASPVLCTVLHWRWGLLEEIQIYKDIADLKML